MAAVVYEGLAFMQREAFHFTDKNSVVTCGILREHVAGQVRESVLQERDARGSPLELNAHARVDFGILLRLRKMLGEGLLFLVENVDAKAALGRKKGHKAGIMIHADED